MREIITLQLGQRSNYLATHFWNVQESYFTYGEQEQVVVDHDVHFRSGMGVDRSETYTPRALIYDLKGGFGSLKKYNSLYELSDGVLPEALWDGSTTTQRQETIAPSQYQKQLEEGLPTSQLVPGQVRYWSDFNRVFFHPRSIVQLNEYELNSRLTPFEDWSTGQDLFSSVDKESDLLDRDVRPFAEECDQLDAFQVFASTDDAWGGFGASYLDKLRDEYGKTSIWVWGQEDGQRVSRQAEIRRTANVARSLESLAPRVSAFIRLSIPPLNTGTARLDWISLWSKTALTCAAVDTMTLPDRLRDTSGRPGSLSEMARLSGAGSRTLFDLKCTVNSKKNQKDDDSKPRTTDLQLSFSSSKLPQLTGKAPHTFDQIEVHRCLQDKDIAASNDNDSKTHLYTTALAFPELTSFPADMSNVVGGSSIRTSLSTTSETQSRLKEMGRLIAKSIELETRETLLNNLSELGEAYATGWQSGSDDESDD